MKSKSEGKRLGKIAFWISEIIVILLIMGIIINSFLKKGTIDAGLISSLLLFQGTVFGTVWGAKAVKNITKKGGSSSELPGDN